MAVIMLILRTRPTVLATLIMAWGIAVILGLELLWQFQSTPGSKTGGENPAWPRGTSIQASSDGLTLVMFVHPRCPCTVASVGELRRITGGLSQTPHLHLIVLQPLEHDEHWQNNDLVNQARQLPQADVHWDQGGKIAQLFGAKTSGQVLLFNPQGQCLYRGGITGLRGQEGPSREGDVLYGCIASGRQADHDYPVFGCALQD